MPTVFTVGGHRFFFYANERNELPHVHIQSAERSAKYWLNPVALARSAGYNAPELRVLRNYVEQHRGRLEDAWDDFFRRR